MLSNLVCILNVFIFGAAPFALYSYFALVCRPSLLCDRSAYTFFYVFMCTFHTSLLFYVCALYWRLQLSIYVDFVVMLCMVPISIAQCSACFL